MYVPSFMKISIGFQAILRFCLNNLKGYNFGISEGFMNYAFEMGPCAMVYIYIYIYIYIYQVL
jgi:hypothetical protein